MALYPQGVREYEVIGEKGNQIRLTLYRTYGFMGKENYFIVQVVLQGKELLKHLMHNY